MLHEYALEPSLLRSWSDFRFLISQFGVEKGRLIARFPSRSWKRMVYNSLGTCKPVERKRIEEALLRIDDRMIPRSANAWNANVTWLENAESEHKVRPFRGIVAEHNQRQHPAVIQADAIDDTIDISQLDDADSRRLWAAERSKIIKRDAPEMANAIDVFMREAQTIFFVDAHFGPENARHRIPFEEFMTRIAERASSNLPSRVEVHCAVKSDKAYFQKECDDKLAPKIPIGMSVTFHRWDPDDLHNRFVLSEIGGVAFLEGLDQYMGGKGRKEDVAVLLDKGVSGSLMDQYVEEKSDFRHQDSHTVRGLL